MQFINKLAGENLSSIYVITGVVDNRAAWWVLNIRNSMLKVFEDKLEDELDDGGIDLSQYGQVLEKGWGTEIPAEIIHKFEAQFSG